MIRNDDCPKRIQLAKWSDSRAKPFYVRYGKDRRVRSFKTEAERDVFVSALIPLMEREREAKEWDPAEWARYLDFKGRVKLPLEEVEEILQQVKVCGLRINGVQSARNSGFPTP